MSGSPTDNGAYVRLRRWMDNLPYPHRCPECRHWTLGILEGCTGIRFEVCSPCAMGERVASPDSEPSE